MSTLPQEANTYRVALLIGVAEVDTVIDWADRKIQAEAKPANTLIEVSLGRSSTLSVLVQHLAELTGNTKDVRSIKKAFAMVSDRVRNKSIEVETAVMNCYRFLRSEDLLFHDDFLIFQKLEDDLSLIRDAVVGRDRLPQLQADLLEAIDLIQEASRRLG